MQLTVVFNYFCAVKNDTSFIDFENSIGPWLGRTVKLIDYVLQEAFAINNIDLTKEQMVVLKKLHDNDGLNQNELAFLTLRNKSSLTRLLTKMENKKYILRLQSDKDKRVKNIFLTSLGKEVFTKSKPVIKEMLTKIETSISNEEKEFMINTLKKIQRNFNTKIESF
nr:MarR family transcriptional regulator [Polaribacter sp. Z022]